MGLVDLVQCVAGGDKQLAAALNPDESLFAAEARYRLPSGAVGWRMLRSSPRRMPDGSTVWDGVELDVTEQKRAQLERAQLEERLGHRQRMESIG